MKQRIVHNAKNQLNLVVKLARTEGPQTVARREKPTAAKMAAKKFKKLHPTRETPLEFFSRFKGIARALVRRNDLPRKIET